ncbi:hypothetical protein FACS1894199_08330 [Bacteroidia bacterium]|nr:hypothetical protein FACS1894199_08330 [Bacteroidia bacterium]
MKTVKIFFTASICLIMACSVCSCLNEDYANTPWYSVSVSVVQKTDSVRGTVFAPHIWARTNVPLSSARYSADKLSNNVTLDKISSLIFENSTLTYYGLDTVNDTYGIFLTEESGKIEGRSGKVNVRNEDVLGTFVVDSFYFDGRIVTLSWQEAVTSATHYGFMISFNQGSEESPKYYRVLNYFVYEAKEKLSNNKCYLSGDWLNGASPGTLVQVTPIVLNLTDEHSLYLEGPAKTLKVGDKTFQK